MTDPSNVRDTNTEPQNGSPAQVGSESVENEAPGRSEAEAPRAETAEGSDEAAGTSTSRDADEAEDIPTSQGADEAEGTSAPADASEETADADADAEGETGADAEADAAEEETGAGAEADAAEGETGGEKSAKRKRKRRRRKKKPAQEGAGDHKKDANAVPFLRFFEGTGALGRRNPFSVGDVVAGRVVALDQGAIQLDLFGKATAYADAHEPHEVPVAPAASAETSSSQNVASGQQEASDASQATDAAEGTSDAATDAPAEDAGGPGPQDAQETVRIARTVAVSDIAPRTADRTESGEGAEAPDTREATDAAEAKEAERGSEADPAEATEAERGSEADPAEATEAERGSEAEAEDTTEAVESADSTEASQSEATPVEPPPVGGIFRGRIGAIAESGHAAIVNRSIDPEAARRRIEQARDEKRRVQGLVFGFNRGGFDVLVEGVRVFCPASGMSLDGVDDPHTHIGQTLPFTVPPSKEGTGLVVSRRTILEREQRKRVRRRMKELEAGQQLRGRVTQIRDFGLLVDLGDGLEGLVHQSEVSWKRGVQPSDVASTGDEIDVQVLDVKRASRKERHGRVSLSIRALQPDPWQQHTDVLKEGAARRGTVASTTDFGAFIELAPGVEGLLHISELGRNLKHAKEAVSEGSEIDVVVERVDPDNRRVSLSKLSPQEAQLLESGELDPAKRPKSLKPGSHLTVLVERVEHSGVFARVQGVVGKKGRCFVPNRELRGEEGPIDRKRLEPGASLEVKVVGTERGGQLRCSVRARQVDEERKAVQEYRKEASQKGLGTFGDLLRAKLEGALEEQQDKDKNQTG